MDDDRLKAIYERAKEWRQKPELHEDGVPGSFVMATFAMEEIARAEADRHPDPQALADAELEQLARDIYVQLAPHRAVDPVMESFDSAIAFLAERDARRKARREDAKP